jgi:hypothetical protein
LPFEAGRGWHRMGCHTVNSVRQACAGRGDERKKVSSAPVRARSVRCVRVGARPRSAPSWILRRQACRTSLFHACTVESRAMGEKRDLTIWTEMHKTVGGRKAQGWYRADSDTVTVETAHGTKSTWLSPGGDPSVLAYFVSLRTRGRLD